MILNYSNFFYQLKKINYFESNSKIIVSVSGGVDSIVLVFLLSRWVIINKFNITAIIIDHKLRPESSIEAKKVSKYLSKFNINNKILIWKHPKNLSNGIQKKARFERLNILRKYCNKHNILHLFMGHHYDDNLETFILRKVSGSNLQGLNAIKILSLYKNIQIIRPLLNFTKKEIIRFAKKNSLTWFEDPSNKNLVFARSKIRKFISKNNIIRNKIIIEYKKNTTVYSDYIEMIYSNLSIIILHLSYKSNDIILFNFLTPKSNKASSIPSVDIFDDT